jgi:hypothetical protein
MSSGTSKEIEGKTLTVYPVRALDSAGNIVPPIELTVPGNPEEVYDIVFPLTAKEASLPQVEVYNSHSEKLEPIANDDDMAGIAALAEAKVKATAEAGSDPGDTLSAPKSRVSKLKKMGSGALALTLAACGFISGSPTPEVGPDGTATPKAIATETAIPPTATLIETATPTPFNPIEEKTQTPAQERPQITLEMTKNPELPLKLGEDSEQIIGGRPAKDFYDAIQKRFPTSDVYYSQDPQGQGWILYATLGSNLFYATVTDPAGNEQYSNAPLAFSTDNGDLEVAGNYELINIPDTLAVIWVNGLPQFVSGLVKVANGDIYYSEYMEYKTYAEDRNPWQKVPDAAAMETLMPQIEPGTMYLDPDYSLGGLVAINADNSAKMYDYIADAFYRINKDYFAKLGVTNSADAIKYMQGNVLPAGFEYPTRKAVNRGASALHLNPSSEQINVKNIKIRLVDNNQFLARSSFYEGDLAVVVAAEEGVFAPVFGGFELVTNGTNFDLVLNFVDSNPDWASKLAGFPDTTGHFDQSNIDKLNTVLQAFIYGLRGLDYNEPIAVLKDDPKYDLKNDLGGNLYDLNKNNIFSGYAPLGILNYIEKIKYADLPPPILELVKK